MLHPGLAGTCLGPFVAAVLSLSAPPADAELLKPLTPDSQYNVTLNVTPPQLFPGATAYVGLSISSINGPPPPLRDASNPDRAITVFVMGSTRQPPKDGLQQTDYSLRLEIDRSAGPHRYPIFFYFQLEGQPQLTTEIVALPVGVTHDGLLEVNDKAADAEVITGSSATSDLWLKNDYTEYDVSIDQIDLTSQPNYLARLVSIDGETKATVREQRAVFDPPLIVPANGQKLVRMTLAFAPPPFGDALRGLDGSSVELALTYGESGGRRISENKLHRTLKVRPSLWLAALAVLIGIGVGSWLGYATYLGKIQSSRDRGKAIATNAVVGVLMVFAVVVGHLKLSIFSLETSGTNPVLLMLLATLAAFGGMPLFKKAFKITDPVLVLLGVSAWYLAGSPAHAAPRHPANAPVASTTTFQKGLFLLNNDDITDGAAESFKKVTASEGKRAEDAQYYLGLYFQRKYYITKSRTQVGDWASLYYSEKELRGYIAKYGTEGTGKWLADAWFALVLIDIERNDPIKLKRDRAGLRSAEGRDGEVYVYEVVWSRRAGDVVDAQFQTSYLAKVLEDVTEGGPGSPTIPSLTSTLRAKKIQSYPTSGDAPQ